MAFAQETVGLSRQFWLATCNARCCVMSRDFFYRMASLLRRTSEGDEVSVESLHRGSVEVFVSGIYASGK